jgi:hypothetical protein
VPEAKVDLPGGASAALAVGGRFTYPQISMPVGSLVGCVAAPDFVATVRGYEGTPYHHQGRVPGVAMDCPAPVICAAWEHGLKPRSFDVKGYPRNADGRVLKAFCDEHMIAIDWSQAQPGDVPLCAWTRERMLPRHLGVLVDVTPGRMWWVQADGYRYKQVKLHRLMFGSDGMHLVQLYRVPGVV